MRRSAIFASFVRPMLRIIYRRAICICEEEMLRLGWRLITALVVRWGQGSASDGNEKVCEILAQCLLSKVVFENFIFTPQPIQFS